MKKNRIGITQMANRLIAYFGDGALAKAREACESHRKVGDQYGTQKWAEISEKIASVCRQPHGTTHSD